MTAARCPWPRGRVGRGFGAFLVLLVLAPGLGRAARAADARDAFTNYLLEVQELSRLEDKAVEAQVHALRKVKAHKMSDVAFVQVLARQVIPTYTRFVARLKKIKNSSPELTRLHKLYVAGAGLQLKGYRGQLNGVRKGDPRAVHVANRALEKGSRMIGKYLKSVASLKRKYHLK